MATLSVAVAAHPKRKEQVDQLLEKLGWPAWAVWDEKDDEWDTHERAWRTYRTKLATHHLVLQDDAVISDNLATAVENGLDYLPNNAICSLYFGNAQRYPKIVRATERANDAGASWILAGGTWWGVGIIIPTPLIENMLEFCSKRREVYDRRLTVWCEYGKGGPYPVYYPWPSLIDHRDEASLVNPGRLPGRKAFQFIGEDAAKWDPSGPTVQCGRISGHLTKLVGGVNRRG